MQKIIKDFAEKIANGTIEIYNEFSLQHELGIFLRGQSTFSNMKVQFERPVPFFGCDETLVKKEIDIAIYSEDAEGDQVKEAILELKFPRKGQYPEQMFSFCKDICFCEQLKKVGFKTSYFLVFVEDKLFYDGANQGIYQFFRSPQNELHGVISKPTGSHDDSISISIEGHYLISWNAVKDKMKYALVEAECGSTALIVDGNSHNLINPQEKKMNWNDKQEVLEAVKKKGTDLQYASDELRADKEVVLVAVEMNGLALSYASVELRADKEVVLAAVKNDGWALKFAADELRADKEVVLEAVKQNGYALYYASEELRADKEVVLEAVKENGLALEFVSDELMEEKDVVLEAVKQDIDSLKYASDEFKEDEDLLTQYIKYQIKAYGSFKDAKESDAFDGFDCDLCIDPNEFKCPSCESNEIRFYQGVPAEDTYYAYEIDVETGSYGEQIELLPRMDRVDRVKAETFYMCHGCMNSWDSWKKCKSACAK